MVAPSWDIAGASVLGTAHAKSGLQNQDAVGWWPDIGGGPVAIVAVADGHGSAKCFRSSTGAAIAVDVAVTTMEALSDSAESDLRVAATELPTLLITAWNEAVAADIDAHPISRDEWRDLEQAAGEGAVREVAASPVFAYGSTLLAALASGNVLVLFQIGDGDILTVTDAAHVERPMPDDPRVIGNTTTSLAGQNAADDARLVIADAGASEIALVMLSTDGYSNSFADSSGFLEVGSDLLELIGEHGLDVVSQRLGGWLAQASQLGSGDDVTVGLLSRRGTGDG